MPKIENTTGMPINLIIDELKSDDIRKRIHSVKNLNLIASTIGPDRTKNELIPFIQELLDDDDEVLLELVESLSNNFVEFVNGQPLVLLSTFEALCRMEESTVRQKAAVQVKKCLGSITDAKKFEELAMGLLKRLNESDYFMAKSAVGTIIPAVIANVSVANQNELLSYVTKMSVDTIPSVRKFASMTLHELIKSYPNITENYISGILNAFIKDEQDFVRMYVVDSLISLSRTQMGQKNPNFGLPMYKLLAEDQSWRVRYYFCEKFGEIGDTVGKDSFKKNFQGYLLKFLQDPEPEMKSIATLKIERICQLMDVEDIVNKIMPLLKTTLLDQNAFVRNALASSLLALCPVIGKKNTGELILPMFLTLLKDADSEVRITLFKKLSLITNILGVEQLSQSVVPALTELAQDKNWRIRAQTIEVLGFFAKAVGPEFLNDKVLKILLDWMQDKVFSVRQASIAASQSLISILGVQWAERNLLQKIWAFQSIPNYLHRITVLSTIIQISSSLSQDYLSKQIVPIIQAMSKDSVANIRSNVCKTIVATIQHHKDKDSLKRVIQALCDDPDQEVKYQARNALECLPS